MVLENAVIEMLVPRPGRVEGPLAARGSLKTKKGW